MNDLKNIASTIRSRRTVKQFTNKNVDSDLILKAIDLARWAPNHHLTEPWHFYILNDSIIKKCIELIRVIVTEKKGEEIGRIIGYVDFEDKDLINWLKEYDS